MLIDLEPRGSSTTVRAANTQRVLDVLRSRAHEWLPVRVLSEISGISRPTVARVCEVLVAAGWATLAEGVSQGVGRPAREYRFRSDLRSLAAVLLTPSSVTLRISDLSGRVMAKAKRTGQTLRCPGAAAETIADLVRATVGEHEEEAQEPAILTVSVPFLVDPQGRILSPQAAPEWEGHALLRALDEALPLTQIILANDSRLAAEAELNHGVLRGVDSAVYLYPGAGYEPSMIVHGSGYGGAHGAAGAGGLVPVLPRLEGGLTLEDLVKRSEAGDAQAKGQLSFLLEHSATGVALLVSAIDPQLVVLGGALSRVLQEAEPGLVAAFRELLRYPPTIVGGSLEREQAILLGGIDRALAAMDLKHIASH